MPMNANIFKLQWISRNFIDSHFLHELVPSIHDNLFNKGDDPFKLFSTANCGDLSILGLEPRFLRFWPSLTMTKFLG